MNLRPGGTKPVSAGAAVFPGRSRTHLSYPVSPGWVWGVSLTRQTCARLPLTSPPQLAYGLGVLECVPLPLGSCLRTTDRARGAFGAPRLLWEQPMAKRWKPGRRPIIRVKTDPPEYKLWLKLQGKRVTPDRWRGVGGFFQFVDETGGLFVDIRDRRQHTLDILTTTRAKRLANSDAISKE
jgi:hypothetical protein